MSLDSMRQGQVSQLLMQHRTALFSYIYACVRTHDDADDILQNVCVVVTESIDKLDHEDGFLPWAREIARRQMLSHFRKLKREPPIDPETANHLAEAAHRVDRAIPVSQHSAALAACLKKLPPESRETIIMRYDGSVSAVEELAVKISRSVPATYSLIKRIKSSLRTCVEQRIRLENS